MPPVTLFIKNLKTQSITKKVSIDSALWDSLGGRRGQIIFYLVGIFFCVCVREREREKKRKRERKRMRDRETESLRECERARAREGGRKGGRERERDRKCGNLTAAVALRVDSDMSTTRPFIDITSLKRKKKRTKESVLSRWKGGVSRLEFQSM